MRCARVTQPVSAPVVCGCGEAGIPLPGQIQFSEDSLRRISSIQFSEMAGASYAAPLEVRRVSCISRVALEIVTVKRDLLIPVEP